MTFVKDLLNAGIDFNDAQTLESHYANEPEFVNGLEMIARSMALNQPVSMFPPAGEPWKTFHAGMSNGTDLQQAFMQCIGALSAELQVAISGAISTRMAQLQQFAQAQQVSPGKKRKTADYVKILENLGYKFKYNLCTYNIEVNGKPITDLQAAEIRGKLRDAGAGNIQAAEDAYTANAGANCYHPMRNYLYDLKYQGQDIITELADFFQDANGVFPVFLRRWLVGAVARVMSRAQNRMMVMDGPQGIGKDYFARWLCSPMPEYYHEGAINPEDKDCRLRLLSTWIWNASELGATTRKSDREALKAFLTFETIRDRKSYGHYDIQGPAMASFIGTINNDGGFLSDPTGNRRFMVCKLTSIDWAYSKLDVDQIWAQAYELYLTGCPWDLQPDELTAANEINEQYQVTDIVEEAIKELFVIDPTDTQNWMSTYEIIEILKADNNFVSGIKGGNLKPGSEIDTRRLASALIKLGLVKTDPKADAGNKRRRGYFGIRHRGP